jgi:hypothetical protein
MSLEKWISRRDAAIMPQVQAKANKIAEKADSERLGPVQFQHSPLRNRPGMGPTLGAVTHPCTRAFP